MRMFPGRDLIAWKSESCFIRVNSNTNILFVLALSCTAYGLAVILSIPKWMCKEMYSHCMVAAQETWESGSRQQVVQTPRSLLPWA